MGHLKFGNLVRLRRIVEYTLGADEHRAFKNYIKDGLPNVIRRTTYHVWTVGPAIIYGYGVYWWGESTFHHLQRKNPKDYENDE